MIPGKKYRPEDFIQIAWKRKWLILIPFVVTTVATAFAARSLPNRFRSESLIQIVPQRVPESYVRSTVTTRIEDRLQSLRQQILNRTRLEQIIDEFKLFATERNRRVMEDLVEELRTDINIEIVKGDAFKISYQAADPRTAMRITERLASLIIEENLRDRASLAEGADQFFETQLDDARHRLVEHEQKLEEYRRRHSGELPSQLESNLTVIHNLQMQLQSLAESLNRDRDRRLMLERSLADATAPDTAPRPPSAPDAAGSVDSNVPAAEQLEMARRALKALELRFTPAHPDIVRVNHTIAELEKKVAAEAADPSASVDARSRLSAAEVARRDRVKDIQGEIANLDLQISRRQQEDAQIRQTAAAYQARVEAAPTRESELVALTRDYDTLQRVYTNLLSKKEDAKVSANLERRQIGEQFKVLDPARLPEKPASPNRMQIDLIGALAGLAFGVGLAALLEYLNSTLASDEDVVSSLSLPVLALVPIAANATEVIGVKRRRRITFLVGSAATVLCVMVLVWRLVL